ncbi:MAG: HAD family hydrolase [Actinomycetia bacterium]|nr:HAD family hydrolase [Actinomycetes bacterium]
MARFDGVIFDWMLTLAHYPSPAEHVAAAMTNLGRPVVPAEVERIVTAMAKARGLPEVRAAQKVEDTSAEAHRRSEHLLYRSAGMGPGLADQMYRLLGSPEFHPLYPDALPVVDELHRMGVKIGVVSDIHVDLRVHAQQFGFSELIDAWALSFELGVQKPDPQICRAALSQLDTDPERTLMVGDRPSRDGAACELGMTCLILPAPARATSRGLDAVISLVKDQS